MGKKRKNQEINSSSMADIAFLLLIFFLVTTSMSTSTGLARRLPPPLQNTNPPQVNKRNLLEVKVNSTNQLMVGGELMDVRDLKAKAEEFIENPNNDPKLPAKVKVNIPLLGEMEITKNHVISLQNDVDTRYQAYIDVQNELIAAYDDLRNKLAKQKFGKAYEDCSDEQQKAIQDVYKMNISEAEPKSYGGNK